MYSLPSPSPQFAPSSGERSKLVKEAPCGIHYPEFVFCRLQPNVLQLRHMSKTVTIRLTKELATWLEQASKQSGVPKGRIVREQLEKARDGGKEPSFMRLAGSVRGVRDLSTRKGFSRS
jgi:hypothetical protein